MKKIYCLIFICLFVTNVFLQLYKSNLPELGGDESASYIALVPFLQSAVNFHLFPSFLQYFHEPIQLLIQIPFVFVGLSEFLARLPNILSGILLFIVLYKIGEHIFREDKIPQIVLLGLYTLSGYFLLSRISLNIGLFALLISLFILNPIGSKKSLLWLFFAIFTYIDAAFLLPGVVLEKLIAGNKGLNHFFRKLVIFLVITILIYGLYAAVVYFGSVYSGAYSWIQAAPFRLVIRGAGLTYFGGISSNILTFEGVLGTWLTIFLSVLVGASILDRRAQRYWIYFLVPLIWLNLIPKPTVHLLHFYPLTVCLAAIGWSFIWKNLSFLTRIFWIIITTTVFVQSFIFLSAKLQKVSANNYKIVGTYIQEHTGLCDKVMTDVEGQTARLYFGRGYTTELSPETRIAVLEKENPALTGSLLERGFKQVDYIGQETKINLWINGENINNSPVDYYKFSSLLPYIVPCSKIGIRKFP